MSGIVGSKFNIRGSGLVASYGTDGQHMLSAGAGVSNVFETVAAGGGKILQIVQNQWTSSQSTTATLGSYTALTDSVTAITPASTGNSILIMVNVAISGASYHSFYKLQHDGSGSYADVSGSMGDGASGSRINITSRSGVGGDATNTISSTFTYIDAPSKDAEFNYQLIFNSRAAGTVVTNTSSEQTDAAYIGFQGSTITLFELDGDGS